MATIRQQCGRWQAIIRRKGHPQQSKTFAKKALAERWARQQEEALEVLGVTPQAQRTTLAALLAWYGAEISPRKRSGEREASRLRILSAHFGDSLSVAELTPARVVAYVDERRRAGCVADTIRKELGTLSVVIDAAIALRGLALPANPVATAKGVLRVTKTLPAGASRDRRPTPAELAALYSERIGPLVEFAVETAMRRGELAAMRWDHVRGTVLEIPQTKTDRARTIPLSRRALEILGPLSRETPTVWILSADAITRAFTRSCARLGIVGLRFHDLRHEGTSRFFERGFLVHEVAAITGHEDWESLKRYTHLCPVALSERL